MEKRSRFSRESKREAVRLLESGRPVEEVAADIGVSRISLWRWRQELERERAAEPAPPGALGPAQELLRLRRRVKELEEERAILKKATAFFARQSR